MTEADLEEVIEMHLKVLGQTLNAQLGRDHLLRLYISTLKSPRSFCFVDRERGSLTGFITGISDVRTLEDNIMSSFSLKEKAILALKVLSRPSFLWDYIDSCHVKRLLKSRARNIPNLLTICVSQTHQGRGVGGRLLIALTEVFQRENLDCFYLDTKKNNERANNFYRSHGFLYIGSTRASNLYKKHIS